MSLRTEYSAQFAWRDWSRILDCLPELEGQHVLDLGCGIGDLAAEFVKRGCHVTGFDLNKDLLEAARSRSLPRAAFRLHDLADPLGCTGADGIWCSFTAAYFCDLPAALHNWSHSLKCGGWIAVTEIDDMFGHEPVSERTRERFRAFADDAKSQARYDFFMGRKLEACLSGTGFNISHAFAVEDRELSFDGPAPPEIVDAWRDRFARMSALRKFCGAAFPRMQDEFLASLASPHHRSEAKVCCVIAAK